MRKGTRRFILSEVFWLVLKFLPIIAYLIFIAQQIRNGADISTDYNAKYGFYSFIMKFDGGQYFNEPSSIIWKITMAVGNLMKTLGISTTYGQAITYVGFHMILIEFMHIAVDVIAFLPRFITKIFDKILGDKAE